MRPTIVACTPRFWTLLYNQYLHDLHNAYKKHLAESESAVQGDAQGETKNAIGDESKCHEKQTECSISSDDDELDTKQTNLAPKEGISGNSICSTKSSHDTEGLDMSKVPLDIKQKVLRKYKSVLGGREQLVSTGGAPTGENVKRFMIECFNGFPQEGYGTTEVNTIHIQRQLLRYYMSSNYPFKQCIVHFVEWLAIHTHSNLYVFGESERHYTHSYNHPTRLHIYNIGYLRTIK